jgi:hypothetical protein
MTLRTLFHPETAEDKLQAVPLMCCAVPLALVIGAALLVLALVLL